MREEGLTGQAAIPCKILAAGERSPGREGEVAGRQERTDRAIPGAAALDTGAGPRTAVRSPGNTHTRGWALIPPLMQPRVKRVYAERGHQDGRQSGGFRKP